MSRCGTWRWSKHSGRFLTLPEWHAEKARLSGPTSRSDLPCPMIISDCAEFRSMADGQMYTSKRAYEASIKSQGLEIVGNSDLSKYSSDPYAQFDSKAYTDDLASDVKTAIEQVEAKL